MAGAHHHTQTLVEMGFCDFFACAGVDPQSAILPSILDYRLEPVCLAKFLTFNETVFFMVSSFL
jgi:hypothetical protein